MSETVQSEHSYFNHGIDDDDSSHSSSFKGKSPVALQFTTSSENETL